MTIRAVLFDLDGTLADTAPDLAGALNALLVERHRPPIPVDAARPVTSSGARGMLRVGFGIDPSGDDRACSPSSPKAGLLVALGLAGVALLHRRIV